MADVVKTALAGLKDPERYICKQGVPWFRPHIREVFNEKSGKFEKVEVNELDLSEIAEHMQALEAEGRAFRITNGHIDKQAKEQDQPELLGLALNPRLGKFGPKQIPCVLLDEYILADKADKIRERPYRSAEYYRQKKLITGCAALVRDPQLNLGTILYSADDATVFYGEPVSAAVPELSANDNDLSPEEVELFERFMKYMQTKQASQQPVNNAAMGPMNATMPQPAAYQEFDMAEVVTKPEDAVHYAELRREADESRKRADSLEKELAGIRAERQREKAEKILDVLEKIEHFKFDRAEELELMQATDDAGREKIAGRIRKYHEKLPGFEAEVPVDYSADNRKLPDRKDPNANPAHDAPDHYQETLDYVKAHPGVGYDEAEAAVKARRK